MMLRRAFWLSVAGVGAELSKAVVCRLNATYISLYCFHQEPSRLASTRGKVAQQGSRQCTGRAGQEAACASGESSRSARLAYKRCGRHVRGTARVVSAESEKIDLRLAGEGLSIIAAGAETT
ncbi:hypothetical protein BDV18DRAFT_129681 [Aspergillus unguis]